MPEVRMQVLGQRSQEQEKLLVLASDGLSDMISEYELASFAGRGKVNPKTMVQNLVCEARKRWELQKNSYIDDITCVIISLK